MKTALQLLAEHETRCLNCVEDRRVVAAAVQAWHDSEVARWARRIDVLEQRMARMVDIAEGREVVL